MEEQGAAVSLFEVSIQNKCLQFNMQNVSTVLTVLPPLIITETPDYDA